MVPVQLFHTRQYRWSTSQIYVTSKLKLKSVCFFTNTPHEQIFKSFGCIKICKDSKWTKTRQNEVMQPTTSNTDSRPVFPYHVHNQADFDNPFINGRGFIYLRISKTTFTF